ncbi:MAG: hypothetical protein NUV80_05130, partial [Candidatus Berkelbacteria bacterium]|nr:hypothetical protein [Candidatus Berkelbacteria bacterium]
SRSRLMTTLYYADGTTYQGKPEDSPKWGLVAIGRPDDVLGVGVLAGDYFAFHDDRWWNHDLIGLIDTLVNSQVSVLRVGRYVGEEQFRELVRTIPEKSGTDGRLRK